MAVQAWACDAEGYGTSNALAAAWANSSAPWLAPLVWHFRLSGLFLAIFAMSTLTQQLVALKRLDSFEGSAILAADFCGMHGLARVLSTDSDMTQTEFDCFGPSKIHLERSSLLWKSYVKLFLENSLQLVLQSSFLALMFDWFTPLGRAKLIFSIALGLLSVVLQTATVVIHYIQVIILAVVAQFTVLCPQVATILCSIWTVLKLYHMFHCESHLWNFSGCVPPS